MKDKSYIQQKLLQIAKGLTIPSILIIFWIVGSAQNWFNSYIIPPPQKVLTALIRITENGTLFSSIAVSLMRVLCGFTISTILASLLALILFLCPFLYAYIRPSLDFIRHIPPLAIISLLILWFGIGEAPKIVVVALACFFPIFLNFWSGIQQCDPKLIEVGKVAQMSQFMVFKKIIFPSLMPFMLVGLQLGLSYGWRSLVGAELIVASSGLGHMIMEARELAKSDVIIIGVIALGIMGAGIDTIFFRITKKLLSYQTDKSTNYEMY